MLEAILNLSAIHFCKLSENPSFIDIITYSRKKATNTNFEYGKANIANKNRSIKMDTGENGMASKKLEQIVYSKPASWR